MLLHTTTTYSLNFFLCRVVIEELCVWHVFVPDGLNYCILSLSTLARNVGRAFIFVLIWDGVGEVDRN